jgi:demethylphylloquinone reductase
LTEVDEWEIAPTFTELLKNTSVQFVKDKVKFLRPCDHLHHGRTNKVVSNTAGTVDLESGTSIEYDW